MVFFAEISFRNGQLGGGGGTDPARIGEFEPSITFCGVVVGRRVARARPAPTPRSEDATRVRPGKRGSATGGQLRRFRRPSGSSHNGCLLIGIWRFLDHERSNKISISSNSRRT